MLRTKLSGRARHGYNVSCSSFATDKVACVAGQNYGISGVGTLYVLQRQPEQKLLSEVVRRQWLGALFDVTWSEETDGVLVTASGDGSLQLWDLHLPEIEPVKVFGEHNQEVSSVDWVQVRTAPQHFLSSSWDSSLKLWDPHRSESLRTFLGHQGIAYEVAWSPHVAGLFASVGSDQTLSLWSVENPSPNPIQQLYAHGGEVLSCDWSKYSDNVIATASVDKLIHIWDLRNIASPVCTLSGHTMAVRKVRFSPHAIDKVASSSYDFTVRIWDLSQTEPLLETFEHHTEFTIGLDFNLHVKGEVVDCSWDETVCMYMPGSLRE
jgi:peroxin-7